MLIFIVFISLHYFRTKSQLESCKKQCENKGIRNIVMPSEETKISELIPKI